MAESLCSHFTAADVEYAITIIQSTNASLLDKDSMTCMHVSTWIVHHAMWSHIYDVAHNANCFSLLLFLLFHLIFHCNSVIWVVPRMTQPLLSILPNRSISCASEFENRSSFIVGIVGIFSIPMYLIIYLEKRGNTRLLLTRKCLKNLIALVVTLHFPGKIHFVNVFNPAIFIQLFVNDYLREHNVSRQRSTEVRGICNMGSTCFMSSVLQVLFHNPILAAKRQMQDRWDCVFFNQHYAQVYSQRTSSNEMAGLRFVHFTRDLFFKNLNIFFR